MTKLKDIPWNNYQIIKHLVNICMKKVNRRVVRKLPITNYDDQFHKPL